MLRSRKLRSIVCIRRSWLPCDAVDGVKDGLIGDPQKCKFDPASMLCKGADSDNCLTAGPSGDSED